MGKRELLLIAKTTVTRELESLAKKHKKQYQAKEKPCCAENHLIKPSASDKLGSKCSS